jgi:hypothetical protein
MEDFKKILDKIACIDIRIVIFILLVLVAAFYGYLKYAKEDEEDCQCGNNN